MNPITQHSATPSVPAHHAQALAATALRTWPRTIGLTIEHVTHHDQGPQGSVTLAVVRGSAPVRSVFLLRCDGYGLVSRGASTPTTTARGAGTRPPRTCPSTTRACATSTCPHSPEAPGSDIRTTPRTAESPPWEPNRAR